VKSSGSDQQQLQQLPTSPPTAAGSQHPHQHHQQPNHHHQQQPPQRAAWYGAVADGTVFEVPATLEAAAAASSVQGSGCAGEEGAGAAGHRAVAVAAAVRRQLSDAVWHYPVSPHQAVRYRVFRDIYDRG